MKSQQIELIALSKVVPDVNQPRQEFSPEAMERLEHSIKAQGILTPLSLEILPDGRYLIVDGERRYRASKTVGLKEIPAVICDAMAPQERLIKRFHLQEQHSSWSAYDKARAIVALQEEMGLNQGELAATLGISVTTIKGYLSLTQLSKRTVDATIKARLPFDVLRELAVTTAKVDSVKTKAALEAALLSKLERKVITSARDFRKYRVAIKYGGEEMIEKIIKEENLTPSEALKKSDGEMAVALKSVLSNLAWAASSVTKLQEEAGYEHLTEVQALNFKKVAEIIIEFVKKSEFAHVLKK